RVLPIWRQGPSCPGNMGQDRRARTAKFGTAVPCRVATLGKGREASGARPQPETARERTWTYVTEPGSARTQRRAAYRPAPLLCCPGNMGQDRRARRAKFGTARPCRLAATLGKGREARGARPQPELTGLGRKGTPVRSSVKRVEWRSHSGSRANQLTASHAKMPRRASYRPAPLHNLFTLEAHAA